MSSSLTVTLTHDTHFATDNFDAVAYESIVVGLFSIITGKRCVPPRPFKRGGEQDAVYVGFSRDGFNFQRSPVRAEAFLPMSKTYHAWNFQNVQSVGGGFLTLADQLRFFVGARSGDCTGARTCTDPLHGRWDGNGTTGTAQLRRDGFASITPSVLGAAGVLSTMPLEFGGRAHLFVNLRANDTKSGLLVELLDDGGKVAQKSRRLHGVDNTRLLVPWEGAGDLGRWAHAMARGLAPPRLRFTLTGGAHLFSFWFSMDANCGASGGPVAAGGSTFTSAWDTHGACGR